MNEPEVMLHPDWKTTRGLNKSNQTGRKNCITECVWVNERWKRRGRGKKRKQDSLTLQKPIIALVWCCYISVDDKQQMSASLLTRKYWAN